MYTVYPRNIKKPLYKISHPKISCKKREKNKPWVWYVFPSFVLTPEVSAIRCFSKVPYHQRCQGHANFSQVHDQLQVRPKWNVSGNVTKPRERIHIPPNGNRKIIDSKVPSKRDMLISKRVMLLSIITLTVLFMMLTIFVDDDDDDDNDGIDAADVCWRWCWCW